MRRFNIELVLLALIAAGCASPAPAPTATPSPILTIAPTLTPTLTPMPTPTATPSPVSSPTLDAPRLLTGVNLAGADFGAPDKRPGVFGTDYTYPTHAEVDYFVAKGIGYKISILSS